ncbi:hypothetical protein HanXRQr2_Chr15g0709001 [Helianthus annuus]|uniref:Uncharacterized protein n=1 Tax=Helianthus annuus TaxID=4232 RepID=A0A9K3H4A3_HELAN|nr:hypothetical protein HanXRQr2_Chr15g0709001 [Helianthus annuus]KAJ0452365.1 hypothetical protein HanHA300_Chr15g0578061 [Helianthus annuus]KAJ0474261.1 hypothetical protein HanHA89_Chr15g0627651 [Helianthus annuus]
MSVRPLKSFLQKKLLNVRFRMALLRKHLLIADGCFCAGCLCLLTVL